MHPIRFSQLGFLARTKIATRSSSTCKMTLRTYAGVLYSVINRARIYHWSASAQGLLTDLLTPILLPNEKCLQVSSPRKHSAWGAHLVSRFLANLPQLVALLPSLAHTPPAPRRFIKRFCESSGTVRASLADEWGLCTQHRRDAAVAQGNPNRSS